MIEKKEGSKTWQKKGVSVAYMFWEMYPHFSAGMLHDDKPRNKSDIFQWVSHILEWKYQKANHLGQLMLQVRYCLVKELVFMDQQFTAEIIKWYWKWGFCLLALQWRQQDNRCLHGTVPGALYISLSYFPSPGTHKGDTAFDHSG